MIPIKIFHAAAILLLPVSIAALLNRRRVAFFSSFLFSSAICLGIIVIPDILHISSWKPHPSGNLPITSVLYALVFSLVYGGFWAGVAALARHLHSHENGDLDGSLIVEEEKRVGNSPEYQRRTNIGVGIGILLQVSGFLLIPFPDHAAALLGMPLILISIPVFIWGCMNYAQWKWYSKWTGLVGLAGLMGLIVLMILPAQRPDGSTEPVKVHKLVALILLLAGLGILLLGRWFDDHEYISILNNENVHIGHPWPAVCMPLGVCVVISSLILLLVECRRG